MQEIYKDIKGYEGHYQISNFGNVKSTKPYFKNHRIVKQENAKSKNTFYKRVSLTLESKTTRFLVHRLVAQHFIDNPENKPQVNHIDNDTTNNHIDNLQWVTASENMKHSKDQGRQDKVTLLAAEAMAKANKLASKTKYDALINIDINGRTLLSYYKNGKHFKGNFKCGCCEKEFTAELDASLRNINRELPLYCRSCTKKG